MSDVQGQEEKDPFVGSEPTQDDTPVVEVPAVKVPAVEVPVVETPVVEAPVVEAPVVEAPVVAAPIVEALPVDTPPAAATVLSAADSTANHGHGVLDEILSLAEFWGGDVAIEVKRLLDKAKGLYDIGVVTPADGARYAAFKAAQE